MTFTKHFSLFLLVVILSSCKAPQENAVLLPPLPMRNIGRAAVSTIPGISISYKTITNGFGHIEYYFHTTEAWQGWMEQQSEDGVSWETFAQHDTTKVNAGTEFVIVNTNPEVYPNRHYRLLRTK